MAQTSYERGEGRQGLDQTEDSQEGGGFFVGGSSLRVIPRLSVSERYDSNVFSGAGRQVSDYVTDIRPGARMSYSSDLLDGTAMGVAISSIYARNPDLNYVGANVVLSATLDKMTERVVRGLRLSLSEAVMYYPEQPAFITPESPESDFTRGIQARRNNSLNNVTRAQGTYAMTPLTQFNASYSFQTRRYLGQPSASDPSVPLALFNNTIHSVSAGPMYNITPSHSIGASYAYRQVLFESTTGASANSSSVIHGGAIIWNSILSRELTAEISPGVSILASTPDRLIWTMRAGLRWQHDRTAVAISYTRGLYPSFYAQAGLLISNVVGGTLTYGLTSQWSVVLGANYAQNTRTGQGDLRFQSVGVNGALRYTFYPGMTVSVTGRHGDFTIEHSGSTFNYDRQMGMVSLSAEWN